MPSKEPKLHPWKFQQTVTSTIRATATNLRSYCRPIEEKDNKLETWEQATARVIGHQQWLWERALGRPLNEMELAELQELGQLIVDHKASPGGRPMWLGGTHIARTRESSMFNCSFGHSKTLYDVVDQFWLLLQGCGVGFAPYVGSLHGYRRPLEKIEVIRSTRTIEQWKNGEKGVEKNVETFDKETGVWTIKVGDSAKAWAKVVGKLLLGEFPARVLILDLSEIRAAGIRLKGYGWISSGDEQISKAFPAIAKILSDKCDQLLSKIDGLDILNHLGTVLSSRRAAEIALMHFGDPEWMDFATAKKDYWKFNRDHRRQSNNSLLFDKKPTKKELEQIFQLMQEAGGSEPGFINMAEMRRRAPWAEGANPCCEILLPDKGFCNLSEINVVAFRGDLPGLQRALYLIGRANYRQTCVDLHDGILQEAWHTNNDFLRLCGVALTGITSRPDLTPYDYKMLRNIAVSAAHGMAKELGTPMPKNVTTIKPSGTFTKGMGTMELGEVPEGGHLPLGKYIFNEITFSVHDELVQRFRDAGYHVMEKPLEPESVLVRFPVCYEGCQFTRKTVTHKDGTKEVVEVNDESAIDQLDRYKMLMDNWCDQNVSVTIYYDPKEIPGIIKWLLKNWDSYVGVSFLYRDDPTKNAEDLGYPYLPQTVVSEKTYKEYVSQLKPVDFSGVHYADIQEEGCATGACPIR